MRLALRLSLVLGVALTACASDAPAERRPGSDTGEEPAAAQRASTAERVAPVPTETSCAEVQAEHPALEKSFTLAAEVRRSVSDKSVGLLEWFKTAQKLAGQLEERRDLVQQLVCADNVDIDHCVEPVALHCESIPFGVDTMVLDERVMTPVETHAVNLELLGGPKNFAELCCGDFGCTENGVSLPFDGNVATFANVYMVADASGELGDNARKSMTLTAGALESATCTCFMPPRDKQMAFASFVSQQAKGAPKALASDLHRMAAVIQGGLPEKDCPIPGY